MSFAPWVIDDTPKREVTSSGVWDFSCPPQPWQSRANVCRSRFTFREPFPVAGGRITGIENAADARYGSIRRPESLARIADQHFQEGLFPEATFEHRRALEQAPHNVDIYNNLELTLHYIDRSRESVDILEQGIALDANHQRFWLTLGFVQLNRGDASRARRALATAAELDPGSRVGREATRLLDEIPQ